MSQKKILIVLINKRVVNKADDLMKEFEKIYNIHFEKIFRFVYRLIGDLHKAEDITQDTFLKLYNYLKNNENINHPQSWLYQVSANLSKNHIKRNNIYRRLISKNETITTTSDDNLEDNILQSEKISMFRYALKKLSVRDQVLLQLYRDGLSYKEIAEISNVKITSVGKMLSRAISKCTRLIEKELL